jgi:hypothetical protein
MMPKRKVNKNKGGEKLEFDKRTEKEQRTTEKRAVCKKY